MDDADAVGWRCLWCRCHRCYDGRSQHIQWGWFWYCRTCFLAEIKGDLLDAAQTYPAWRAAIRTMLDETRDELPPDTAMPSL